MLTGAHTRTITADWRGHVMPHDQRIAEMTGQPFGTAYFDGLLNDLGAVLDSEPPTTALLAAEELAGRGLDMLARQQQAHYVEGRRISAPAVLLELGRGSDEPTSELQSHRETRVLLQHKTEERLS